MAVPAYVDAAMDRLVKALDRRDAFAADIDQLALLSVVEGDLFGRGRARPHRGALVVVAARFWSGIAALAGFGRAIALMSPEAGAHWTAGPAAWPPTPSSLARFLSERHALVRTPPSGPAGARPGRASVDLCAGTPAPPPDTPAGAAHIEVRRIDALLGWLAADLDARLRSAARPLPTIADRAYAPADAHILWRAHDIALSRALYVLVDEATVTPRASSYVVWAVPSGAATILALPDVAPDGPWSGAPLAAAFAGLTGAEGSGAPAVAFVDLPVGLRMAAMATGAAALPMRAVRVPPGAMQRAIERGRAVWAVLDLRAAIDARKRRQNTQSIEADDERAPGADVIEAATVVRETLAAAIDDDAVCGAAGRLGPKAIHALGAPFWDAARLLGVDFGGLVNMAAMEAACAVARVALGRI